MASPAQDHDHSADHAADRSADRTAGREADRIVVPLCPQPAVRPDAEGREPLWRDVVGEALRRARLDQQRTLRDVADAAGISLPYLSELERGRKEASSEVLAAAARALGLRLADLLVLTRRQLFVADHTATGATVTGATGATGTGSGAAGRTTPVASFRAEVRLAA